MTNIKGLYVFSNDMITTSCITCFGQFRVLDMSKGTGLDECN